MEENIDVNFRANVDDASLNNVQDAFNKIAKEWADAGDNTAREIIEVLGLSNVSQQINQIRNLGSQLRDLEKNHSKNAQQIISTTNRMAESIDDFGTRMAKAHEIARDPRTMSQIKSWGNAWKNDINQVIKNAEKMRMVLTGSITNVKTDKSLEIAAGVNASKFHKNNGKYGGYVYTTQQGQHGADLMVTRFGGDASNRREMTSTEFKIVGSGEEGALNFKGGAGKVKNISLNSDDTTTLSALASSGKYGSLGIGALDARGITGLSGSILLAGSVTKDIIASSFKSSSTSAKNAEDRFKALNSAARGSYSSVYNQTIGLVTNFYGAIDQLHTTAIKTLLDEKTRLTTGAFSGSFAQNLEKDLEGNKSLADDLLKIAKAEYERLRIEGTKEGSAAQNTLKRMGVYGRSDIDFSSMNRDVAAILENLVEVNPKQKILDVLAKAYQGMFKGNDFSKIATRLASMSMNLVEQVQDALPDSDAHQALMALMKGQRLHIGDNENMSTDLYKSLDKFLETTNNIPTFLRRRLGAVMAVIREATPSITNASRHEISLDALNADEFGGILNSLDAGSNELYGNMLDRKLARQALKESLEPFRKEFNFRKMFTRSEPEEATPRGTKGTATGRQEPEKQPEKQPEKEPKPTTVRKRTPTPERPRAQRVDNIAPPPLEEEEKPVNLIKATLDSLAVDRIAMMPGQTPLGQEVTRILKKYNLGRLISHITENLSETFEPLNKLVRGFTATASTGSLVKAITSFDTGISSYIKGLRDSFVKWNAPIAPSVESFSYTRGGKESTGYRLTDVSDVANARPRGSANAGPDMYEARPQGSNLAPRFINFETFSAEMLRRTLANEDRTRIVRELTKFKDTAPQEIAKLVPKIRDFFGDINTSLPDGVTDYLNDLRDRFKKWNAPVAPSVEEIVADGKTIRRLTGVADVDNARDRDDPNAGPEVYRTRDSGGQVFINKETYDAETERRKRAGEDRTKVKKVTDAATDVIKTEARAAAEAVQSITENFKDFGKTALAVVKAALPAALDKLKNALDKVGGALRELAQNLGQLRNSLNQAFSQGINLAKQFSSSMLGGLNKVGSSLDALGKKYEGFGKRVKNGFESAKESASTLYFLSSTMSQAGSKLTGFGNRGLQNTKQFLDEYSKYEMAVNRVAVSGQVGDVNNPEEGFQTVQDFVFGLQRGAYSREDSLGNQKPIMVDLYNAEELAQATYYYQSAAGAVGGGLETQGGQEAMAKILGPIMNMAAATQTNPEEYIKGVVNIAQQFAIDPTQAANADMIANIANVVGQIANVTTLEIPDILETFKYVGPQLNMLAGGQQGAGLGDALMLVEMASRAGIKGSMAGTGIGQIVSTFVDVPKAVAESVAPLLGLGDLKGDAAIQGFEGMFQTEDGKIEGGILGAISKIVESTSGEPQEVAKVLSKIFTQNATRTSSAIASQLIKAAESQQFLDAAQAYNEGDFEKANALYEEAMARTSDTVTASVQRVKNAFFQLKVTMFDAVKSPLKDYLNDLANIFFELSDAVRSNKGLSQLVAGIAAVASVVATGLGALLGFGGALFMIQRSFIMAGGSISLFLGIITTVFSGFFAMLPVILLIGVAVAALIGHFKSSEQSISDFIATLRGDFGEGLGQLISDKVEIVRESLSLAAKAFYEFVNVVLMGTTAVKDGMNFFEGFGKAAENGSLGIAAFNTDILQMGNLVELLSRAFGERAAAGLLGLFDHIAGRLVGFRGEVDTTVTDIVTKVKALKGLGSIAQGLVQAFAGGGQIEAPTLTGINNFAQVFGIENLPGIIKEAAAFIWDLFGTIIAFAEYLNEQLTTIFQDTKASIKAAFVGGASDVDVFAVALSFVQGILAGVSITILALANIVRYLAQQMALAANSEGGGFLKTAEAITGITMSLENLSKTAGVVFGMVLGAKLLMSFKPIGQAVVGITQLGVSLAKVGAQVGFAVLQFGMMAAQLAMNVVLIGLQAAAWGASTAAQVAASGIGMMLSAIQMGQAAAQKAQAEAQQLAAKAAQEATNEQIKQTAAKTADIATSSAAMAKTLSAVEAQNKLENETSNATKAILEQISAALAQIQKLMELSTGLALATSSTDELVEKFDKLTEEEIQNATVAAQLILAQTGIKESAESAAKAVQELKEETADAGSEAIQNATGSAVEAAALDRVEESAEGAADALDHKGDESNDAAQGAKKNTIASLMESIANMNLAATVMAVAGALLVLAGIYVIALLGALLFTAVIVGMLAYLGGVQAAWDGLKLAGMAFYEVILQMVAVGQSIIDWAMSFMGLGESVGGLMNLLTQMGTILGYLIGLPLLGIFAGLVAGVALAVRAFKALGQFVSANSRILLAVGSIIAKTLVSAFKLIVAVIRAVVSALKVLAPVFLILGAAAVLVIAVIGKVMNVLKALMPVIGFILTLVLSLVSGFALLAAATVVARGAKLLLNAVILVTSTLLKILQGQLTLTAIKTTLLAKVQALHAATMKKAGLAARFLNLALSGGWIGLILAGLLALVAAVLHFSGALKGVTGFLGKLAGMGADDPFEGVTTGANAATEALDNLARANITANWLSPSEQQQTSYAFADDTNPYEDAARIVEIRKVTGAVTFADAAGSQFGGSAAIGEDGFNIYRNGEMVYNLTPPRVEGRGTLTGDVFGFDEKGIDNTRVRQQADEAGNLVYEVYLNDELRGRIGSNVTGWGGSINEGALDDISDGWVSTETLEKVLNSNQGWTDKEINIGVDDYLGPSMAPQQMTLSEYNKQYGVNLSAINPATSARALDTNIYMIEDTATVKTNLGYEELDQKTGESTGKIIEATSFLGELYKTRQEEAARLAEGGASDVDGGLLAVPTAQGLAARVMNSPFMTSVLDTIGMAPADLSDAQQATDKVSLAQVQAVRESVENTAAEGILKPYLDAAEAEAARLEALEEERAKLLDRIKAAEESLGYVPEYLETELGILDGQIAETGDTLEEFTKATEAATAQQERTTAILNSVIEELKTQMPSFLSFVASSQNQTRMGINTFAQLLAGNTAIADRAIEEAKDFAYFDSITGEQRTRDFTQQDFFLKGLPPNPPPEFGGNMEAFLRSDHQDAVRWRENLIYQGIDPYSVIQDSVGSNPYMVDERVFQASLGVFASGATQNQKDLMDRGFFDTPEVISFMTNQAMLGTGDPNVDKDGAGLIDYYATLGYSTEEATAMLQRHWNELPEDLKKVYGKFENGQWVMDIVKMDRAVTSDMFDEVAGLAFDASGNVVKATSDVLAGIPVAYETALGKSVMMTEAEYAALSEVQKAMLTEAGVTVLTYMSADQEELHEAAGTKVGQAYASAYGQSLESGFADIDGDGLIDKYVVDEAGIRVKVNLDLFFESFSGLDKLTEELSQTEFIIGSLYEQGLLSNEDLGQIREVMEVDSTLGDGGILDDLFATLAPEVQAALLPMLTDADGSGESDAYEKFLKDREAIASPIKTAMEEGGKAAGDYISQAMIEAALLADFAKRGFKGGRYVLDRETGEINWVDEQSIDAALSSGAGFIGIKGRSQGGAITTPDDDFMNPYVDPAMERFRNQMATWDVEDVTNPTVRNKDNIWAGGAAVWGEMAAEGGYTGETTNVIEAFLDIEGPDWLDDFLAFVASPDIASTLTMEIKKGIVDPIVDWAYSIWDDVTGFPGQPDAPPEGTPRLEAGYNRDLYGENARLYREGGWTAIAWGTVPDSIYTGFDGEEYPYGIFANLYVTVELDSALENFIDGDISLGWVDEFDGEGNEAFEALYKILKDASNDYKLPKDISLENNKDREDPDGSILDNVDRAGKNDTTGDGYISLDDVAASINIAELMETQQMNREEAVAYAQSVVAALQQEGIISPEEATALNTNIEAQNNNLGILFEEQVMPLLTESLLGNQTSLDTFIAGWSTETTAAASAISAEAAKAANSLIASGISMAQDVALAVMLAGSNNPTYVDPLAPGANPYHASGGIVSSPFAMVGELGRELVSLPMGSRVFSASQTEDILSESFKPTVNMMATSVEMPSSLQVETDSRASQSSSGDNIVVNFNGDMNIRDQRDIELLVDEIDRELGRRTQNAKRGMAGTTRSVSVD